MGKIGSIKDMQEFQDKLAQYNTNQFNIINLSDIFKDLPKKRYNLLTNNYNAKIKFLKNNKNFNSFNAYSIERL